MVDSIPSCMAASLLVNDTHGGASPNAGDQLARVIQRAGLVMAFALAGVEAV